MIREEDVIRFLKDPDVDIMERKEALSIRERLHDIERQRETLEQEIMETIQMKVTYSDIRTSSGKRRDLYDILAATKSMLAAQEADMTTQYMNLLARAEDNHRLKLSYDALTPISREILAAIYQRDEKWEYIEHRMNLSHSKLVRLRKQAIEDISHLFESELSNHQLAKMRNGEPLHKNKETGKLPDNIPGQMSLDLTGIENGKEKEENETERE